MATARFLERVVAQRPMPLKLVVASSMSIYGEGEYVCEEHGRVAPGPAAGGAAARAQLGAQLRDLRSRAAADRDERGQAADPDVDLRDHQARPRGDVPRHRRRLRDPRGRAALLQRLRAGPGAVESLHGRRGDLRLAPAQRPPADHLRGRRAVARLHPRLRHRARASCSRSSPTALPATPSTSAPARRPRSRRSRASSRPASASTSSPSSTSSTAPATSATASPTRARARAARASRRRCRSRTACASWSRWLKDQEAVDRVDDATSELAARGLTR